MKRIAIFASGSGSNAENIVKYFQKVPNITVVHVFSNNKNAYVLERMRHLGVLSTVFTRDDFYKSTKIVDLLIENQVDLVVLAGFLWLVPTHLIQAFPQRIINIHPALLPKYGGKGMYGHHVHEAVVKNGETQSGISIHLVNDRYDEGDILFQATCDLNAKDTPEMVAQKVHELEYIHFPKVIHEFLELDKFN
jgi:phosphoribosylglycinamide formyltransferase-1